LPGKAEGSGDRKSQWWKIKFPGDMLLLRKFLLGLPWTMWYLYRGSEVQGNIVPCCKACNNRKKYLTPAEIVLNKLKQHDTSEYLEK
jgi:hypothetical protein